VHSHDGAHWPNVPPCASGIEYMQVHQPSLKSLGQTDGSACGTAEWSQLQSPGLGSDNSRPESDAIWQIRSTTAIWTLATTNRLDGEVRQIGCDFKFIECTQKCSMENATQKAPFRNQIGPTDVNRQCTATEPSDDTFERRARASSAAHSPCECGAD